MFVQVNRADSVSPGGIGRQQGPPDIGVVIKQVLIEGFQRGYLRDNDLDVFISVIDRFDQGIKFLRTVGVDTVDAD